MAASMLVSLMKLNRIGLKTQSTALSMPALLRAVVECCRAKRLASAEGFSIEMGALCLALRLRVKAWRLLCRNIIGIGRKQYLVTMPALRYDKFRQA